MNTAVFCLPMSSMLKSLYESISLNCSREANSLIFCLNTDKILPFVSFGAFIVLDANTYGLESSPFKRKYSFVSYTDYPKQYEWFEKAIAKNYENCNVLMNLGWSLQEWKDGQWKEPCSKNNSFLKRKPTEENIAEFAKIKGLDCETAKKYFGRSCETCGKSVTENDIAMSLKMFGRNTNRILCKKCFLKELDIDNDRYMDMMRGFRSQGCNLF